MVVSFAELETMSDQARKDRLAELAHAARTSTKHLSLDQRILAYEAQFCMTSSDMKKAVASGTLYETDEICQWLMCLKLWERIDGRMV